MTKDNRINEPIEKKSRGLGLDINPVLLYGLRSQSRTRRMFLILSSYAVLLGIIVGLVYLGLVFNDHSLLLGVMVTRQLTGKLIFWVVAAIDILAIMVITPVIMAGAISGERETDTFDLLKVTSLAMRSIIFGKLAAGMAFTVLLVAVSLPFQSIVFLLGGVSVEEMLISLWVLVITAIMMSATVLFFSSRASSSGQALAWSYGSVVFLFILLPLVMGLIGPLILSMDNAAGSSSYAALIDVLIILAGWLVIAINPLATLLLSAGLWTTHQTLFVFQYPLRTGGFLPLFSPWVLFSIICILLSLLLLWASTHFADKAAG